MKQEHDYSGALEALDKIENFVHDKHQSDKDNDDVLYGCSFGKIRAALTAAKGDGWLPIESAVEVPYGFMRVYSYKPVKGGRNYGLPRTTNCASSYGNRECDLYMDIPKPPQDGGDDDER